MGTPYLAPLSRQTSASQLHCMMLVSQYLAGFWTTCVFCLIFLNINKSQANPVIADEDFLRDLYYEDLSPISYNADMEDMRLVDKRSRQRQAGFSSWAGKRGGRNMQGFSAWAGKRSGRQNQGFSSWAGKRAPFNAWAGKRSGAGPIYHVPEYERLEQNTIT